MTKIGLLKAIGATAAMAMFATPAFADCSGETCAPTPDTSNPEVDTSNPAIMGLAIDVTVMGGTAGFGQTIAGADGYSAGAWTETIKSSDLILASTITGANDGCPEGCGTSGGAFDGYASEQVWTGGAAFAESFGEGPVTAVSGVVNESSAVTALLGSISLTRGPTTEGD